MNSKTAVALLGAIVACFAWSSREMAGQQPAAASIPSLSDEFVGPFLSWSNVKTHYGAVGDGVRDDSAAIQRAFDEVGTKGHSSVLFFPAGMYRISKTVAVISRIQVSIVGEDPATTTLVWDGQAGGTMVRLEGMAYSRFVRFTLDGKRRASTAVDQSMIAGRNYFDTGNEYSDNTFVDVEYGLRGGWRDGGFAETAIRRSQFIRNTRAGVALGNFNALDIWVWDSRFEDCGAGVTNIERAGNFHVYNSVFRRSKTADISIGNTGGFSARGNYSTGSRAFFTAGATNNPAQITIQGNTVIDPIDPMPLAFANQGPGLVIDNTIRSAASTKGPVISWLNYTGADLVSAGNVFSVANPILDNGRLMTFDDRVVRASTINSAEPSLPGPLPDLHRQVFEVPPGADTAVIQGVINAAARATGSRPVVHFSEGTYSVRGTLTVPASDIQIVGDGTTTTLKWAAEDSGTLFRLSGPTKVTLREISVDGSGKADDVVIDNVDQPGARIYLGQTQLTTASRSSLLVNGLDEAIVQAEDIGHEQARKGSVSIKVLGGPRSAAGQRTAGRVNIFSGASSGNFVCYEVSNGGRLLVRDIWYEGPAGPGFASVHDRALFTFEGGRIATQAGQTPPVFDIRNLNGRAAVLTTQMEDRISVAGDGSQAMVLALGLMVEQKTANYVLNATSPSARVVLLNSRHLSTLPGIRSGPSPNSGEASIEFLKAMLSHTRGEHAARIAALPAGVTDVRLFRVMLTGGLNDLTLNPGGR